MRQIEPIIKIALAILFSVCLLDMPYGYYELVRFIALVGFGVLAYQAFDKNRTTEMLIYGALALLFQPFFKIALGREIWNVVDILVSLGLLISLFLNRKTENK
jgi:hypothetical protein